MTPCKLCVTLCCFYRAKNHGRLWRVNACVEYANEVKFIVQHIFRRFWKENSAEERFLTAITCLILKKIELFYSHVTRTCKLVVLFALEEAFKVFVYFHAVQVSSTNFEISTYGFWICSLADAILMHFTKKSVSIVAIYIVAVHVVLRGYFCLDTCFWLDDSKNTANTFNIFLPKGAAVVTWLLFLCILILNYFHTFSILPWCTIFSLPKLMLVDCLQPAK